MWSSKAVAKRQPIVIGIDLGHECTKVGVSVPVSGAYPLDPTDIHFQAKQPHNILPTVVTFSKIDTAIGHDSPVKGNDGSVETFRWFKLAALSSTPGSDGQVKSLSGETVKPAQELLDIFLSQLHLKIHNWLSTKYPWLDHRCQEIDYVFSVPSIVGLEGAAILVERAKACNFEAIKSKHKVFDVVLTEPEAAGAFVIYKMATDLGLKKGHTALIMDLGGGTSDLSMMTIADNDKWKLDTNFLQSVSSQALGGAHMERALLDFVRDFFLQRGSHPTAVADLVKEVQKSDEFAESKIELCGLSLELKQANAGIVSPPIGENESAEIRLEGNNLTIDPGVFERMLDHQILGTTGLDGIAGQAVTMRDDLFVRCPTRSARYRKINDLEVKVGYEPLGLDFVIFTGGFSQYTRLRQKVEEAVKTSADSISDCGLAQTTESTSFFGWKQSELKTNVPDRMAWNPQIFVCFGLVLHHIDELLRGEAQGAFKHKTWFKSLLSRKRNDPRRTR